VTLNASIRSVDLRIAIGEHYGFDFETRARQSNSNSLAAIYFLREHLDIIADDLGIDGSEIPKSELRDKIRAACGCSRRSVDAFDWAELKAIVETVGIDVDDTFYDVSLGSEAVDTSDEALNRPDQTTGAWTDWGGEPSVE